jgi:hypothetical protein
MACIVSGKKVDDSLRNDIRDLLSDIAASSEPVLRKIMIKNVWRKTFNFVNKHLATFQTRGEKLRNEITSSGSPESRVLAMRRQRTHLTSMRKIREFFVAYPVTMGETLEWQDDWKRIMSGETADSLFATSSSQSDRSRTASMDGADPPACVNKGTSLQPVEQRAYQTELIGVDSPKIQASTAGGKTSNIDEASCGIYSWFFTALIS